MVTSVHALMSLFSENMTKKITLLLLAFLPLFITACGDDNNEPTPQGQVRSTITIKYTGYDVEKYYGFNAYWDYDSRKDKTTFWATFKEKSDDFIPDYELWFSVKGNIGNTGVVNLMDITFSFITTSIFDRTPHDQSGGQALVKSIKGDKITLVFNDVKYGNATLNGEVTYTYEQI